MTNKSMRTFYVNKNSGCLSVYTVGFTPVAGSVTCQTIDILRAEHEEADTRLE